MSSRWPLTTGIVRAIALTAAALVGAGIREVIARRRHTIPGTMKAAHAHETTPAPAPAHTSDTDPAPTSARTAEPEGLPSSVLANRLAIDVEFPPPTLEELDLQEAKVQAFAWQQQRGHASLNDVHGHISGRPGGRWVSEVHGIMGVVAEQVLLSIEAESEKVICADALGGTGAGAISPAARAHYSRSLRFFAEGQANAIVIACHGLANLVLRSIEFDQPLTAAELKKLRTKESAFKPRSEAKSAWISMAKETLDDLAAVADVRSASTQAMVAALRAIYDEPAVNTLFELRNVQYHRWRGETAGVTGLARSAETASETLASGKVFAVRSGPLLAEYTEGQRTLDELVKSSRDALDSLVPHLEPLHEAWYEAFLEAFSPWRP